MKHSIIFKLFCFTAATLSSCLFLSSCNKEICSEADNTIREKITINIGVTSSQTTKATGVTDENENKISNVQIFVFREDGALDAYTRSTSGSLTLSCTAGERTIYALANAPSLTTVSSLPSFLNTTSLLFDNELDAFQMIGGVKTELYSGANVQLTVKRLVSRIRIEKITTDFTSDVYKNASFSIDNIYIVNAAGSAKLSDFAITNPTTTTPSEWLNQRENCSDQTRFLSDESINYNLANKSSYTTVHTFYTYPNHTEEDSQQSTWCKRFTRLVIEATLGGVKYYYPVSIEDIGANKSYTITNFTITRPGSSSADIPVSKAECTFTTTLSEWTEGSSGVEEI